MGAGGALDPGWYPDPNRSGDLRWWNGSAWTPSVRKRRDAPPLLIAAIVAGGIAACFAFMSFLTVYGDPGPEDGGSKPIPRWAVPVYLATVGFAGSAGLLAGIDTYRQRRRMRTGPTSGINSPK